MKKLTTKNYHLPNKYLTTSKLKDYLTDARYFFDKHVLNIIEEEKTDAMILGSMVDCLISYGNKKYHSLYEPVARRSKDYDGKKCQVTEEMHNSAMLMASAVRNTTVYKELDDFKRQVILTMPLPKNKYFEGFAGMLDFLKVENNPDGTAGMATIVDLKTAHCIDPKKYYWQSLDLNYWLQAASYVKLVSGSYNLPIDKIKFYHLAVEKDPKKIYKVGVFEFNGAKIAETIKYLDELIAEVIGKEKFERPDVCLAGAIELGKEVAAEDVKWEE